MSRREWSWSILWSHWLNYLRKIRVAPPPTERPIPRFQNTVVPAIEGPAYGLFALLTPSYFAIFIAGWNFEFPTKVERTLWRAASLTAITSVLVVCISMNTVYGWLPTLRHRRRDASEPASTSALQPKVPTSKSSNKMVQKMQALASYLTNNSLLRDPELDTPVGLILIIWPCGVLYIVSRVYILVADFIELRSLPRSAYQNVNWSSFWPHL